MNDVYKTPEADLIPESLSDTPQVKIYKVAGVGIATLFGGLIAGGLVLSINFKRLGKFSAAKKALWFSILAFIILIPILFVLPDSFPSMVITVVQIMAMVNITKNYLASTIAAHEEAQMLESNWKAAGIGLSVMLGLFAIMAALAFLVYSITPDMFLTYLEYM